jgi:hypothetical protein
VLDDRTPFSTQDQFGYGYSDQLGSVLCQDCLRKLDSLDNAVAVGVKPARGAAKVVLAMQVKGWRQQKSLIIGNLVRQLGHWDRVCPVPADLDRIIH